MHTCLNMQLLSETVLHCSEYKKRLKAAQTAAKRKEEPVQCEECLAVKDPSVGSKEGGLRRGARPHSVLQQQNQVYSV